jgi:hypothetical protein
MGPKSTSGRSLKPRKNARANKTPEADVSIILGQEEGQESQTNEPPRQPSLPLFNDDEEPDDAERVRWTAKMIEQLMETLLKGKESGKDTDGSGFKKEFWSEVVIAVNTAWDGLGRVSETTCRNKWTAFKDHWKNWNLLAGMSGFGWDEELELYRADPPVWDNLAATYKNIKWHKNNVLNHRDILSTILDGQQATGSGAYSSIAFGLQDELGEEFVGELDPFPSIVDPILLALDRASSSTPTTTRSSTPRLRIASQASIQPTASTLKYVRSKTRLREEEEDDRGMFRKKLDSKSELAQAINGMTNEMVMDRKRRETRDALQDERQKAPERAIAVLYEAYESRMDDSAFIKALNMLDGERSRLFLTLKAGVKRDLWLESTFGVELWQEIEDDNRDI